MIQPAVYVEIGAIFQEISPFGEVIVADFFFFLLLGYDREHEMKVRMGQLVILQA